MSRRIPRGNRPLWLGLLAIMAAVSLAPADDAKPAAQPVDPFAPLVQEDAPVGWWRMDRPADGQPIPNSAAGDHAARTAASPLGGVELDRPGPSPETGHDGFEDSNRAVKFDGRGGRLVIEDPSDTSPFDFDHGDTVTLEAWVNLESIGGGQIVYIVGKGRTGRDGVDPNNQNWAMRLWNIGGAAHLSFLYRDRVAGNGPDDWHRWTADASVTPGSGWHHVALTYTFGEPDSIRGYVDGKPSPGEWDMGGPSKDAPVIDNDQVWIASAMSGSAGSSFDGSIDEVAIYRKALSPDRIAKRYAARKIEPKIAVPEPPAGAVAVQIIEHVPNRSWELAGTNPKITDAYTVDVFGFARTTRKYNAKALIVDRTVPYLLRATADVTLPAGEHELLVRALNSARLYIDDKLVTQTGWMAKGGGAHGKVPPAPEDVAAGVRYLAAGHSEKRVTFKSDGQPHRFRLEAMISSQGLRPEVGELTLSRIDSDGSVVLLAPNDQRVELTDAAWERYEREQEQRLSELNKQRRAEAGAKEAEYWARRHEVTRQAVAARQPVAVPEVSNTGAVRNDIDRFILARLEAEGIAPAELTDDYAFLRRVTLDTVGQLPSPAEIERFFADPADRRRTLAIDRLLADDRWADQWTPYWQDVLAENPAILKATLNNTGPFRYFIHEAMLDNKPMDRFATELMMMEGSTWYGGPAGFAIASENDVPMAAKAHVVGTAFLGVEMKCSRCHDAPFHDNTQQDLFELAAMLKRDSQKVPMSSSIPLDEKAIARMIVEVNLKPGTVVKPDWPFAELSGNAADAPEGMLRRPDDLRAVAAFNTTWHTNDRFAKVIVNRVWARYLGFGLISRPGDWQDLEPSHPELLEYLARELMTSGYDFKHVARLILNSHTYQRAIEADKSAPAGEHEHLFASPARRRMTAEQIVDAMFAAVGKRFGSEMLTMDRDARFGIAMMHNLGYPRHAWEFTSLSNERDRPSLAMPYTQGLLDVLTTFGWRDSRPNPIDCRDDTPTVQQPAVLANGVVARRIATLSDDSALTALALEADSPDDFIEGVYLRLMTREPTPAERELFGKLLSEGFADRIVQAPSVDAAPAPKRAHTVSWSNHLSEEANAIKIEVEQLAVAGDPPTHRLTPDWRQRAEDMVWAVLNSPEFVFLP